MAKKEVHVGDDWYLDENNNGDLIVVNSNTGKVVKAIDKETGDEDKKGNSLNNLSTMTTDQLFTDSRNYDAIIRKLPNGTIKSEGEKEIASGTNAATVIQDTLDFLGEGTSVFVKPGKYIIDTTLSIPRGITFTGVNGNSSVYGTILKLADGANTDLLTYGGDGPAFIKIANFYLDGNSANNTTGSIINGSFSDSLIFNNFFDYAPEYGLTNISWNAKVISNIVEHCQNAGLKAGGTDVEIFGNKFIRNIGNGVELPASNIMFSSNFVYYNENNGLVISGDGTENITIDGNIFKANSKDHAISFNNIQIENDDINYITISNNILDGSHSSEGNITRIAILLIGPGIEDVKIFGNQIHNHTNGKIPNIEPRTVVDGLGKNGSNDPASAGNWNGHGYNGAKVLWDDGTNYYISTYLSGSWYDIQIDSPTI